MKITICPPGHAIGYENTAIVKDGFFRSRDTWAAHRGKHSPMQGIISIRAAERFGSAHGLNTIIDVNKGKV